MKIADILDHDDAGDDGGGDEPSGAAADLLHGIAEKDSGLVHSALKSLIYDCLEERDAPSGKKPRVSDVMSGSEE